MDEDSAFFLIYSISNGVTALLGIASIIIALLAAYKFSKVKGLPWGNVLLFSILVSFVLSLIEWLIIDSFWESSTERLVLAQNVFLVVFAIPILTGCIAIYKIAGHISQNY